MCCYWFLGFLPLPAFAMAMASDLQSASAASFANSEEADVCKAFLGAPDGMSEYKFDQQPN